MTQEEQELLLKELCARLPYGVIVKDRNGVHKLTPGNTEFADLFTGKVNIFPYLRPMSSMTEKEKREIYDWLVENDVDWFDFSKLRLDEILISFDSSWLLVNWLFEHHFDFHGLIPQGLALEAPDDMYK